MQFADSSKLGFSDPGTRHREGNISFKYLLKGRAGSPQNYELSHVRTRDRFYGPPHRHNFDQIRYILSGTFGQPGKLELKAGELGYYPEGTPYQIDSGDSDVLLLQFGGAAGQGFTHYDQLRQHYPILAQKGEFKDGIFRWHEAPPGTAKQQDGYEALWELIHQRPLVYPKPRYHHPTVMNPQAFAWVPTREPGMAIKPMGRFTEREIGVGEVRIDAGARVRLDSPDTIRLLYVLQGSGCIGEHAVHEGCAVEIEQGQSCQAHADQTLVLLEMLLPRFDPAEIDHRSAVAGEALA